MITEVPPDTQCQFDECEQPATEIACGRDGCGDRKGHPEPGVYCKAHADVIANENNPEYWDQCPNCGCRFGVN